MTRTIGKLVVEGQEYQIVIPDGWTGEYSLALDIHKGHASKKIRRGMRTTDELQRPEIT